MTDERVDALIRRLDIASSPDPGFVSATGAVLRTRVRAARVQDMSALGRLRRDLRLAVHRSRWASLPRPIAIGGLLLLLLLALAALVIAGALSRPIQTVNGPLVVAVRGELRAIDVATRASRPISQPGDFAEHVSRSPDGRVVAYWLAERTRDQLVFLGIDGQDRHAVDSGRDLTWGGCTDTWSPDSRYLASEVKLDGASRILVADSRTGQGRFVTPDGVIAHCPLWSPDGRSIAFAEESGSGPTVLAVIGTDGTGLHQVSGDIGGADVAGANSWSEDGIWIYFTTGGDSGSIWRSRVASGSSTRLTGKPGFATAVAASPDGRLISWIVSTPAGWDLYIARSDGTGAHLLLENAMSLGWSADGRYVLAKWMPSSGSGGLTLVAPDGSETRVVVATDESCLDPDQVCDVGWGQARP